MSFALTRLFEGVVATLRTEVIPHIDDAYARGQAVGVIDLLNNVAGRVEWARAPLLEAVREKQRLLALASEALGEPAPAPSEALDVLGSAELIEERARLDAEICETMKRAHGRGADAAAREALGLLIRHAHDEAAAAMKWTRKPQFAEIAGGKDHASRPPG